ncbi:GNAT family N-acetyltransferase [Nonomuraea typhae]|uniref:GNAT family N-acetyltransferase n=1 Tax=Nonomuraea typhae TaxID=2603600 RepID=UPI0012FA1E78|nr:GNAT family N-acetyltransferase [Nonomuraea typhae]
MSPTPAVHRADYADLDQVAHLVGTAFAGLDVVAYMIPDPGRRAPLMSAWAAIMVEDAFKRGHVDVIPGAGAAPLATAVWFHREEPLPAPDDYDRRLAEAVGPHRERFQVVDELLEASHPQEPHHHLLFLAVRPDHQNHGLGTALMDHHHATLSGLPAYLESASTASTRLYLRNGYTERRPIVLPDGARFWPMWRP